MAAFISNTEERMYSCVLECLYMCVEMPWGQRRTLDPKKLAVMSHLTWDFGTEFESSSGRAASTLHHWAISQLEMVAFKKYAEFTDA